MNKTRSQPQYTMKLRLRTHNPKQNSDCKLFSNQINPLNISINNSHSLIIPTNKQDSRLSLNQIDTKSCRICFEEENREKKLISPCLCSGTAGYIHEDCLKTWILETTQQLNENNSYSLSIPKIKCELCHFELVMKFYLSNQFSKEKFKSHLKPLLKAWLLIFGVIFSCVGIVVVILAKFYEGIAQKTKKQIYFYATLTGFALLLISSFIVYWKKYRKQNYVQVLDMWVILDINSPEAITIINKRLNKITAIRKAKGIDDLHNNTVYYMDKKEVEMKKSAIDIRPSLIYRSEFRKKYPFIRSISQIVCT